MIYNGETGWCIDQGHAASKLSLSEHLKQKNEKAMLPHVLQSVVLRFTCASWKQVYAVMRWGNGHNERWPPQNQRTFIFLRWPFKWQLTRWHFDWGKAKVQIPCSNLRWKKAYCPDISWHSSVLPSFFHKRSGGWEESMGLIKCVFVQSRENQNPSFQLILEIKILFSVFSVFFKKNVLVPNNWTNNELHWKLK